MTAPPASRDLQVVASVPADARSLAMARLAGTRARLALQLIPPAAPPLCGANAQPGPLRDRLRAVWRYWRARAHGSPVASVALDAAQRWWAVQPWSGAAELLGRELREAGAPVVRRHPLAAVAVAAALAGGLVWWRPWRSARVARQGQALGRTARGWLLGQLRQLPWQTLMAGAMALWAGQRASAAAEPAGAAAPPVPPAAGHAPYAPYAPYGPPSGTPQAPR